MWLLLVTLCLAQGLGGAVPCMGASHDNPEQFMDIVSARGGVQASPGGVPKVLPEGPARVSPSLILVSAPMGSQGGLGTSSWTALGCWPAGHCIAPLSLVSPPCPYLQGQQFGLWSVPRAPGTLRAFHKSSSSTMRTSSGLPEMVRSHGPRLATPQVERAFEGAGKESEHLPLSWFRLGQS